MPLKKGRHYYESELDHVPVKLNIGTKEDVLNWK